MSGGTAEDGKGAKIPDVTPSSSPAGTPAGPSEWTVSDHRGPLRPSGGAGHADEVERFVPSSEVDAEGLRDVSAAHPAESIHAEAAEATHVESAEPVHAEPVHAEPVHAEPTPAESTPVKPPAAPAAGGAASYPTDAAAAPPSPPRRSLWPVAAGLVIGSLIGAGSAAFVYNMQTGGSAASTETASKLADLASRVDGLEKRPDPQTAVAPAIGDVRNEVHALSGRVAALEKRPAPPPVPAPQPAPPQVQPSPAKPAEAASTAPAKPDEGKAAPIAPVAAAPPPPAPAAGAEIAGKVAALQLALDGLSKQEGSRQAAIKDLSGKLDGLQAALSQVQEAARSSADVAKGQRQDLDGKLAALQTAVSGAQKQANAVQGDLSTVQGGLAAVQGEQKSLAGRVGAPALAVAADSLVAQVEAGKPYRSQLDALAAFGADPARLAVLRENATAGVPSAQALAASFATLADPVIATGSKSPANADFGEQLKHGLFGLVDVRRADDTSGDGLASRVALLQADLAHGDVAGAYAVWAALPADARAKSSAWGLQAKGSAEAVAAARALQAQSIDTLAAKKS